MGEKEERIRSIVKLYYSNQKLQDYLLEFSKNRESVPRYFEGFGKRPDTFQYTSDIMGLVNKGATSFHTSEEIWLDPLNISSDMSASELSEARKSWDLLIDIDSPFLDFSKIAARLLLEELEVFGIKNYAIKFSGSKGFHIIIPGSAFPEIHENKEMRKMFPEWPRAMCEYLMNKIKSKFSMETRSISNIEAMQIRTNKKKEDLVSVNCPECGKQAKEDTWMTLGCDYCNNEIRLKKSVIEKKRVLRCERCRGSLIVKNETPFFECLDCKISNISKIGNSVRNEKFENDIGSVQKMAQGIQEQHTGGFDLVLVSPRHLFRMPYSLHEKTALASVVIDKSELASFTPQMANPLNIKLRSFYPTPEKDEAKRLLIEALNWKRETTSQHEHAENKRRAEQVYEPTNMEGVEEKDFPAPIVKLLKGNLGDGKKRGLFVLITFLRSLDFPIAYVENKVAEWNKTHPDPLREGYVKSQIDWHFKQKKKIMPPNYDNPSFYKDLGLLDKPPVSKNPIVDVVKSLRRRKG